MAVVLAGSPAIAHTTHELDHWVEDWSEAPINRASWEAHLDMAERHPCYFQREDCRPRIPTTAPSAPEPVATTPAGGVVERWRPLVAAHFRPEDVDLAMRILACESTGNPSAKNPGSSATGLFQHLGKYWTARSASAGVPGSSRLDPEANVIVAAWLRDQKGGWRHWSACL